MPAQHVVYADGRLSETPLQTQRIAYGGLRARGAML